MMTLGFENLFFWANRILVKMLAIFFISTVATMLNFFIWQCKLQKKIPVIEKWYYELFYAVEIIRHISNNMRADMNLNLPMCRNWSEEASRRR
jgi:hypothetical protein